LRDQVWTLDDQLRIETIEDNENIPSITNNDLKNRIYSKFGGNYISQIPKTKDSSLINMIKDLDIENVDVLAVKREYYENEVKNLKPLSLAVINLGQRDRVPVVVRQTCISILKKNTEFTAYSNYINKTVIDTQAAYEKNRDKCRMGIARKLFKNKSRRELALAFISLFVSIYSEFLNRLDKKLEEGKSFAQIVEMIDGVPSETVKLELLKLLRSQLQMHGSSIFEECLEMLREFSQLVLVNNDGQLNILQTTSVLDGLTPFFTELMSNAISNEMSSFYQYTRNILWFTNWLVYHRLDAANTVESNQLDLQLDYEKFKIQDHRELRSYESICRSMLSLKL